MGLNDTFSKTRLRRALQNLQWESSASEETLTQPRLGANEVSSVQFSDDWPQRVVLLSSALAGRTPLRTLPATAVGDKCCQSWCFFTTRSVFGQHVGFSTFYGNICVFVRLQFFSARSINGVIK